MLGKQVAKTRRRLWRRGRRKKGDRRKLTCNQRWWNVGNYFLPLGVAPKQRSFRCRLIFSPSSFAIQWHATAIVALHYGRSERIFPLLEALMYMQYYTTDDFI